MSPAMMKGLVAACLFQCTAAMETLRVGGMIQTTGTGSYGKEAFELWANWVNANTMATGFMVNLTIEPYDASILTARIGAMTDSSLFNEDYMDVILCPYGSLTVIACVGAVNSNYKGPIMAWGGASDSIFSGNCANANKHCFGTFTKGSEYFNLALDYYKANDVSTKYDSNQPFTNVAVITNNNPFSQSVASGAKMEIAKSYQYNLQSDTNLQTSQAVLSATDKAHVRKAMMMKPDYVLIAGHNNDVESTILTIAQEGVNYPKIIMATNSLTSLAVTNFGTANLAYMGGVIMPSQWNSDDDSVMDSLTKWSSSDFISNMTTGHATYHAASAAAAGIAISHAYMATSGSAVMRAEDLRNKLMALDINCFYGRLKFNSDGSIHKPMVAQDRYMNVLRTRIWQNSAGTSMAMSPQHSVTQAWPTVIKVAGMLGASSGYDATVKLALETEFNNWLTSQPAYPYTISWDLSTAYSASHDATFYTPRTDPESALIKDIIVCPYTSGRSKLCVDNVHANFSGAILIWGGAADAIFTSNCIGKNCLGSFTKASMYMHPAMTYADSLYTSALNVSSFHYNSAFARSVAMGANTTILGQSGLTGQSFKELDIASAGALQAADLTRIDNAMDHNPDVVVIAGHAGVTEPIIERIGMHTNTPKFIIATNSLPGTYTNADYAKCIIQPDQWNKHATLADPIVGWTATAFIGLSSWSAPTYHVASGASFGIAIANAMAGVPTSVPTSWMDPRNFDNWNTRRMDLYMKMKMLDINSFYGKIKFNSDGSTAKPMYAVQRQGAVDVLVAPSSTSGAVVAKHPLTNASCGWYPNMVTTTTHSGTTIVPTAGTGSSTGATPQTSNAKHVCMYPGFVAVMLSFSMVATRILQ